jgi:septum formation protein
MPPPELILASTSRYRRELLERLGLPFRALAPACDEEALKDPALLPRALAEHLALAKASSLRVQHPDAVIVGSDQLAELDGAILGKPGTAEAAQRQLAAMSGREHRLITAMVVVHGPRRWEHTEIATLHMRSLDAPAIARYVARDQPLDCAGSYKLERGGIALFERIDCADHSAITGLPLLALARILAGMGFETP